MCKSANRQRDSIIKVDFKHVKLNLNYIHIARLAVTFMKMIPDIFAVY